MGAFWHYEEKEDRYDWYGEVDEGHCAPVEEGAQKELDEDAEDDGHGAGGCQHSSKMRDRKSVV